MSDKGAGFLNASPAGVAILTIPPLDHDDAYLVRAQNTTPTQAQVTANLQFPKVQLDEAYLGSVLGDRASAVDSTADNVTIAMGAYEIKTVIVRIKSK